MALRGSITDLYIWNESGQGTVFTINQADFNQYAANFANKNPLLTNVLGKPMYLIEEGSAVKRNITAFFGGASVESLIGTTLAVNDRLDKVLGITLTLGMENGSLILLARSADGKGRYPPELAGADLGQGRQYKIASNGTGTEITGTQFNDLKQTFVTNDAGHARLLSSTGESQFLISNQILYLMLSASGTQAITGSTEIHLGVRQNDPTETITDQKDYVVLIAKKPQADYIVGSTCPPKWYHPGA